MKRTLGAALLCTVLLAGCGSSAVSPPETETMAPAATVPVDGDPHNVTCQGSYTGAGDLSAVVARLEGAELTNEMLQAWYRAEAAQYRQAGAQPAPDFDRPLDTQICQIDDSVVTWQQYFLKQALNRWHTANALIRHSQETPLPIEDAYRGEREVLEEYMAAMPAAKLLYGYHPYYSPNTLHRAYLDSLPETLPEAPTGVSGDALLDMAQQLNYGYMYFTTLTYDLETEASGTGEPLVSFRQILLRPGEQTQEDCAARAEALLEEWMADRKASAATFAQLASQQSQDEASAKSGGLYRNLAREQLPTAMAQWCFAEDRQEGDTTIIREDNAVRILYYLGTERDDGGEAQRLAQEKLLEALREAYPLRVEYDDICLTEGEMTVSLSDVLYPDIAHERFPEVPLYLQQNYAGTMYGEHKITTNGCGVTSLAMLGSYMSDEELTPPEMCDRYGSYSRPTGTAGSLFEDAPPQLGFYLIKKTYDWREARVYMEEGHPVVVCQYKGYWTRGGHYLVLERLTEDGMVQVRDSNLYNYRKLARHKDDKFPWNTISGAGQGYWIYEKKVTSHPACTRCGDPERLECVTVTDYLCQTCATALIRRNTYLG